MTEENHDEKRALLAIEKYSAAAHAEYVHFLDFLRSYAQASTRSLFLLNGGAIIATLTFIGALLAKGEQPHLRLSAVVLREITPALAAYALGLVAAVGVSVSSYLDYRSHALAAPTASHLYLWAMRLEELPRRTEPVARFSRLTTHVAVGLGAASLLLFLIGSWIVWDGFVALEQWAWVEAAPRSGAPRQRP